MVDKEMLSAISDLLEEKLEEKLEVKLEKKLEEKLKPIREDISELKSDVADLKTDMSNVKSDVADLKLDVADLKSRQRNMELVIETELRPQIQLVVETCVPAARRYEESQVQMLAMQMDIDVLKTAARKHGEILKEHTEVLQRIL